jgi:hypothetical protein
MLFYPLPHKGHSHHVKNSIVDTELKKFPLLLKEGWPQYNNNKSITKTFSGSGG